MSPQASWLVACKLAVASSASSLLNEAHTEGRRFGPVALDKAPLVEWTGVPVEVTHFVVEYLSQGQVVGLAQVSVQLVAGQTFRVQNPNILEVSAPDGGATRNISLRDSLRFFCEKNKGPAICWTLAFLDSEVRFNRRIFRDSSLLTQSSALSRFNVRVERLQFHPCIVDFHLPVDTSLG